MLQIAGTDGFAKTEDILISQIKKIAFSYIVF